MKTLCYSIVVIVLALIFVYYLQYVHGLEPCPLCIMQRLVCFLMLLVAGMSLLTHALKKYSTLIFTTLIVLAIAGLYFATRQVWIQHAALDAIPQCAPSLDFMLANFPMHQVLKTLFYGSGDCAKTHWHFLGLSLSEWSVMFFSSLLLLWLRRLFIAFTR
jgi:disulfide bond formation protein DsbB